MFAGSHAAAASQDVEFGSGFGHDGLLRPVKLLAELLRNSSKQLMPEADEQQQKQATTRIIKRHDSPATMYPGR